MERPRIARAAIAQRTGLSRSTVFRVTDDLITEGYLVENETRQGSGRGRPTRPLSVARSHGHVIGIDIGVNTCRLLASDLNGDSLIRWEAETPTSLGVEELAEWLCENIEEQGRAASAGPLKNLVISVPAGVQDGVVIERPASALGHIAGAELYARLSYRLASPFSLRRDPEMALIGEMAAGKARGHRDVALFVVSSAVAASVAVDGKLLEDRRRVLGEFGVMPFGADRTLADVLTVSGVMKACNEHGHSIDSLDGLLELLTSAEVPSAVAEDFTAGISQAIVAMTLSVDPEMILINGRLIPFVAHVLDDVRTRVTAVLPVVPLIDVTETQGYSQPTGAVTVALTRARSDMLVEVVRTA